MEITPANTSIAVALAAGFLQGLRHALDADHLVAVSTIVSEHKSLWRSSLIGTFWGLGHTVSLAVVSIVIILLRPTIPESALPYLETPVAVMLVALGVGAIWRAVRDGGWRIHTHTHTHEQSRHSHHLIRLGRRPFLVGVVHGLAGSAVVTLAVVAAIPSVALGFVWLLVFGVGTIGGMLLMSAAISLPFVLTARRFSTINGAIRVLAGLFSVALGLLIAWEIFGAVQHAAVR